MAGIVFAKFTTPTSRAETIMFSKNALITMRNGSLYLLVRMADLRSTRLIGCLITGQMVSQVTTEEGEVVPYNMASMEFGSNIDGTGTYLSPYWPVIVAHKIDSSSPLYSLTPRDSVFHSYWSRSVQILSSDWWMKCWP